MSAQPVDVLAVLDAYVRGVRIASRLPDSEISLVEARAAVADLSEAAKHYRMAESLPDRHNAQWDALIALYGLPINAQLHQLHKRIGERLDAALARCGGGQ